MIYLLLIVVDKVSLVFGVEIIDFITELGFGIPPPAILIDAVLMLFLAWGGLNFIFLIF